ncbi:MAG TPA: DegQ family serine endoprotease [Chlamydiales bacterium]|nr:DegQ family serine endoprotease [Chlamydiales bacterium]
MKKAFFIGLVAMATAFSGFAASYKNTPGLGYLEETSQAFTGIAKKATPGVVFIKAQYKNVNPFTGAPEQLDNPFDFFSDEFFKRFFGAPRGGMQQPQQQAQVATGSGFLVSADGFILTNYHVVKDSDSLTAILNDGREYPATVIGTDPRTDLAVIKIEEKNLPFLTFGNSDKLDIGEWVVAIGNPFALEASLTVGVVSAKGRQDLGITALEDFIQTDAAINPGNSGGPLLNLNGDVIGINTAIATRSGGYMGIGFAIPSNMAKHVMDQIIDTGTVKRAYLGVILQQIDKELAAATNLTQDEGVLVAEIMKDSPAAKAGMETGDIITELNGKCIKSVNKFRNEIAMMHPGTTIEVKVLRKEKTMTVKIPLGVLSETEVGSQELIQKLGIDVDNLQNLPAEALQKMGFVGTAEGIMITKVKPNSPAANAGLRPYYLITGVVVNWKNQKKVTNVKEFSDALSEIPNKKYVVIIVRHQNYQRYYTLKLN